MASAFQANTSTIFINRGRLASHIRNKGISMKQYLNRAALTALLMIGLSGCGGEPEWVTAYEDCKQQMTEAADKMKSEREANQNSDPQTQAMLETMSNMAVAMGMEACESIKRMCEPDPDSDACQAIVQEYRKDNDSK